MWMISLLPGILCLLESNYLSLDYARVLARTYCTIRQGVRCSIRPSWLRESMESTHIVYSCSFRAWQIVARKLKSPHNRCTLRHRGRHPMQFLNFKHYSVAIAQSVAARWCALSSRKDLSSRRFSRHFERNCARLR